MEVPMFQSGYYAVIQNFSKMHCDIRLCKVYSL